MAEAGEMRGERNERFAGGAISMRPRGRTACRIGGCAQTLAFLNGAFKSINIAFQI